MLVETILATRGSEVATPDSAETISQAVTRMEGTASARSSLSIKPVCRSVFCPNAISRGETRHGARLPDTPIASLMTRDLVTSKPDDSVAKIMAVMTDRRIRHVPVLRDGRLAGIISIGDVVKVRLGEIEQEASALRAYIAGT